MSTAGRFAVALGVAVIVGAVGSACWVGRADFLMLIGGDVLRPTDVSLAVWSLGVLASLGLLGVMVTRQWLRPGGGRGIGAVIGVLLALILVGTGVWCAGQALVSNGVDAFGSNAYTVLRAPAQQGCALIVHESGSLRTSSGEVFVVGSFGLARSAGSWTADEIDFPVRDGAYFVRWNRGVGDLSLHGNRLAMPDRLPVSCHRWS